MRILVVACAALMLAAGPAAASCSKPDKPKLPADAKKPKDVEAADPLVKDYSAKMDAYIKCLDAERASGVKEYTALLDQWNKLIAAYNKAP